MIDDRPLPQPTAGPFRVLPAELNTEIFKLAIWIDTHSIAHGREFPPHVTPLTLGAVCGSWRSFVWETANLWTIIVLKICKERCETQTGNLDLWLRNSKSYPLDIWFDVDYASYESNGGMAALQKLVNESTRWRKCNIFISSSLLEVIGQIHGKIPVLQSAFLQLARSDTLIDTQRPSGHLFEDAPLLKHFALSNGRSLGRLTLPWSQIISIKSKNVAENIWEVLNKCTSLEECEISIGYTSSDRHPTDVCFDLPRLRTLSITESLDGRMAERFQRIRCPNLRRLHLVLDVSDYAHSTRLVHLSQNHIFQHLAGFISRSDCALEHLQLNSFVNISDVLPILDEIPSLQSFVVRNSKITINNMESFFNSLLQKLDLTTNTSTIFLPKLKEIQLEGRHGERGILPHGYRTCSNLLKVLQQRSVQQHGVSKLTTVDVKDVFMPDEEHNRDVVLGIRELNGRGIKITIRGT